MGGEGDLWFAMTECDGADVNRAIAPGQASECLEGLEASGLRPGPIDSNRDPGGKGRIKGG